MAGSSVISRLRRLAPVVSRAGGAVVLLAGGYVAYYGRYELRLLRGRDVADPVIAAVVTLQGWLADGVDQLGAIAVAVAFTAVLTGAVILAWRARSVVRGGTTAGPVDTEPSATHVERSHDG